MSFDKKLRYSKDRFFSRFYLRFWLKLNPNTISTIGFIFGIFAIISILDEMYPLAIVFWILNRILDGFDGLVARTKGEGKGTDFGAYLDIVFDFIIYSFFIFALVLVNFSKVVATIESGVTINLFNNPEAQIVIAGTLLLCLYYINSVSWAFLSLLIEKRKTNATETTMELAFPPALVEKGETIIFYIFFLIFSDFAIEYLVPAFILFGGLILLTIIQRLVFARKVLVPKIIIEPEIDNK